MGWDFFFLVTFGSRTYSELQTARNPKQALFKNVMVISGVTKCSSAEGSICLHFLQIVFVLSDPPPPTHKHARTHARVRARTHTRIAAFTLNKPS